MLPATDDPPIDLNDPLHIAEFEMTNAAGKALTVTVTELDFIHPFELVSVTV